MPKQMLIFGAIINSLNTKNMSIRLSKIAKTNPLDRTKSKYYLVQSKRGTIKLEDFAKEIVARSALTLGDVQSVLSNLVEILPLFISLGQTIHLEGFGTFRLTVKSSGTDTPEELTAHNVKSTKIVFLPSTNLKRSLEHLSFEIDKHVSSGDNHEDGDGEDGGDDMSNHPPAGEH